MKISAVLVAGGKSRRMGQDKATILFRDAPLWQNQLQILRKLSPKEIFVSAPSQPAWRPSDVTFVPDDQPSRGPLSGIAAALSRITTNHLVALAIDMPFMTESYLRSLCERIEPGRGIVPLIENRAEPLAAIYPREAQDDVVAALSGSDFSLQSLICQLIAADKLVAVEVSTEERALFRNLNEPQDLISDR
ncbi:MAG TPA: molybdenum cofactor guanylyltransferase [Chthoniobacterales bacterium]|nr:molybdenum cofactor guanylyltransferase [Chthoniobacterales bacterium]